MQTAFDIGRPIQVLILSEKVLKRVVEGLEKRENVDASLKSCNGEGQISSDHQSESGRATMPRRL